MSHQNNLFINLNSEHNRLETRANDYTEKLCFTHEYCKLIYSTYGIHLRSIRADLMLESALEKTIQVADAYGLLRIKSCQQGVERTEVYFKTAEQAKDFYNSSSSQTLLSYCKQKLEYEMIVCLDYIYGTVAADFKRHVFYYIAVGQHCLDYNGYHTYSRARYVKALNQVQQRLDRELLGQSRNALNLILNAP